MSLNDLPTPGPAADGTHERAGSLVTTNNNGHLPATPISAWPAAGSLRPEILSRGATPLEMWHALRRRWLQAVGFGLLAASILIVAVWFLVPVRYEVAALLRVTTVKGIDGKERNNESEFSNYKRTAAALIRSHFVLQATLRVPEISRLPLIVEQQDAVAWLERSLVVEFPHEAEILKISMRGEHPEQLVKIVNGVKDAYIKEIVEVEREAQLRLADRLKQNVEKYKEEIHKKSSQFYQLARELGTDSSERANQLKRLAVMELNTLVSSKHVLDEELRRCELKLALSKARLEHSKDFRPPESQVESALNREPDIAAMNQRVATLRTIIKQEHNRRTSGTAKKRKGPSRYEEMLAATLEEIEERKIELRPIIMEELDLLSRGRDFSPAVIPMLELEKASTEANIEQKKAEITRQTEEVNKLDKNTSELEARKMELDSLKRVASDMGFQVRHLEAELSIPPRVSLIENATAPSGNNAMSKYMGVGMAGMLGFGLAAFAVAWLEFQSRRLNSPRDVQEGLGIQILGRLPQMSSRAWRKMQATPSGHTRLHGLLAESIDSIRATLIHTTSVDSPRIVMVTSADDREGKTTVASQLAASLARSGRRTLLVDGDMRNPAAHRVFELPQEPGFCELLRGQAETETAVHPTRSPNLWVMPAGRCDLQSVQALSGDALTEAATAWRAQFEFVVIDTGPVLKVADALLLGQHVDATILSVLRDASQMPNIYEASERLKSVGINVLGAVVNGVNEQPGRHHNVELPLLETV